jgi:hypothetical protein
MIRTLLSTLTAAVLAAVLAVAPLPGYTMQASPAAAPPARPASPRSGVVVVVAAAGDIACPPGSPPTPAGCQQRATARAVLAQHPRAVLLLGAASASGC